MSGGVTRAYVRISLDTAESGSIAKQRRRIAAAEVARGRDPEAVSWYSDESVSGSKVLFAERPEGARLLADLQPGDRVVMTKIDRAARNVADLLSLVQRIRGAGASVRFVDNDIDTDGPYGQFMLTMLGALAELEANIISERRKESLGAFVAEGRHAVGKAPIGLRSIPNPSGRGLVLAIDPETAPLVREAVERVMAGESQNSVRESLGLSRVKSPGVV